MPPQDISVPGEAARGLDAAGRDKLAHDLWTRANLLLRIAKEGGNNQGRRAGA